MRGNAERSLALLGGMALTGSTAAQIVAADPFIGTYRESFENLSTFFVPQLACLEGQAIAYQMGGSLGMAVVGGSGTACGMMNAHGGIWFMSPWTGVNVEWVFDQPARRFGGFFGTICEQPGATAEFYDAAGRLMAVMPVNCPAAGQWHWDGWEALGQGFRRVRIISTAPEAGRVRHDDMELDFFGDCYGDCDVSGTLTVADFACFQSWFVAADMRADCNASNSLTIADFGCFQTAFVMGCP